jgi:hypothetical protein
MSYKRLASVGPIIGLLMFSAPLWAHHGNAAFDTSKRVTVKGTVVGWLWANPHCVLTLDVKDDRGNVVRWAAEATIPSDMVKHGWKRTSFNPGDEVSVTLTPAKNGNPAGRIEQVVLANGQILTSGVPPNSPTEPKP